MASSVHINQALLITPSEPTPNHILPLSALDSQLFVRFTFEYLLVYEPRPGADRHAIAHNVKSALARALVPYYPLAGRVRARADGLGLEVVCRAQGVAFIDATSTSTTVSEFESAPRHEAQWWNFLSLHVADVLIGAPPLIVQFTWLHDGGAALAVGFNHCLCDGIGSGEFLNSFAELALGQPALRGPRPIWSRHLLDPVGPSRVGSLSLLEFESVPDISGLAARFSWERLVPTCITFDKSRLDEMKKLAGPGRTSFDVLSGHVWRSWARALDLARDQRVKLAFSVNVRQRVRPSLPSGYYGNAFVLGCAEARVADLAEKGLGFAAEAVAGAKERVGEERVREVVESVSWKRASVDPVGVLVLTQWSRLGLQSVDFGMGRPVQVGPVCCSKYCTVLPVCGVDNALKVNLAVPLTALDQYLYFLTNIDV
ncbi:alcohol acyltransferase 9 [Salvia miltiorrhiza]|uniref:alcohol acyltransferase 9 n=1 Tax=Salvia miltiorrhiza TaxID=226208 RepID=UPI0025ABF2AF|nr:alcohol acyltransferase 9 [Salvia miltiorrhiza]